MLAKTVITLMNMKKIDVKTRKPINKKRLMSRQKSTSINRSFIFQTGKLRGEYENSNSLLLSCRYLDFSRYFAWLNDWRCMAVNVGFLRFPLRNVAVYASLIILSMLNLLLLAESKISRLIAFASLALSLGWYLIGLIWSGNLRLMFANNGEFSLPFSFGVAATCLIAIVLNLLLRVFQIYQAKTKRKPPAD